MQILYALASLSLVASLSFAKESLSEKCSTCKSVAQQFKDGLIRTAKSNFGGGNTDWEEKKLKSFVSSETRLIEILESICSSDKHCSAFLESQEEVIENWWFDSADIIRKTTTEEGSVRAAALLSDFLCVKQNTVCCPNNTYGSSCLPCPTKLTSVPCSGNGNCDGDGTRSGTGKCKCSQGYIGDECASCDTGYFSSADESSDVATCVACEINCKTCLSAGPGQCRECNAGYLLTKIESQEFGSCVDVDECAEAAESPCKTPSTYCANIPGSYKCVSCDSSCDSSGCSGAGPGACIGECVAGYEKRDGRCEDIDECAKAEADGKNICGEAPSDAPAKPICINIPGSYRCGCSDEGYKFGEGTCSKIEVEESKEEADEERGKQKYKEPKPLHNGSKPGSKKTSSALETDFSLIHFGAMLVLAVLAISYLASKPRPWPAVAGALLVITAIYVYYYVASHEPHVSDGDKASAQKGGSKGSSRRS